MEQAQDLCVPVLKVRAQRLCGCELCWITPRCKRSGQGSSRSLPITLRHSKCCVLRNPYFAGMLSETLLMELISITPSKIRGGGLLKETNSKFGAARPHFPPAAMLNSKSALGCNFCLDNLDAVLLPPCAGEDGMLAESRVENFAFSLLVMKPEKSNWAGERCWEDHI